MKERISVSELRNYSKFLWWLYIMFIYFSNVSPILVVIIIETDIKFWSSNDAKLFIDKLIWSKPLLAFERQLLPFSCFLYIFYIYISNSDIYDLQTSSLNIFIIFLMRKLKLYLEAWLLPIIVWFNSYGIKTQ